MNKIGYMQFKQQLEKLMAANNISAATLSKITKIPKSTISDWLSGTNPKSIPQVKKIADHFDVSIDFICFGKENEITSNQIESYSDEINAGVFEVVLRKVKK